MDVGCTLDIGRLFNLLAYFWWIINKYSRDDITICTSGPVKISVGPETVRVISLHCNSLYITFLLY